MRTPISARTDSALWIACALGALSSVAAQERAATQEPEPFSISAGYRDLRARGDVVEHVFTGGIRYVDPRNGLDVRADRGVLVADQETGFDLSRRALEAERRETLPRRGPPLPDARRAYGESVLRDRLRAFLSAARREPKPTIPAETGLDAFRSIYFEGDVAVVQQGLETMRASSLFYSAVDDRAVLRDVTLRLSGEGAGGRDVLVTVRAPELVKQGPRIVGRDVSVTTCPAGEPHWEVMSGEIEILQHDDEFEIRSRDNVLAFSRTGVLPIPNQTWFTSDQTSFPIKSASIGYSEREGAEARIVFGSTFNTLGGAAHEALTGRPAEEFRGEWRLGTGWIEERGFPFDVDLEYAASDLYFGRTRGFVLHDNGRNIRDIRNYIDGTPIDVESRWLAQTENRIAFDERTTLDLTYFDASDPAVFSEFYEASYYAEERPESSVYGRHADENLLITGDVRWNEASFSYGSGRQLEERFVEQLPYFTVDWFAEPLLELPFDSELLLTTATNVGQLRSNYDDRFVGGVDDDTWRFDQRVELSAPFLFDPITFRPFVAGRYSWYENTPADEHENRVGLTGGAELGSRLSRTWRWISEAGDAVALRHELLPTVRFEDTWLVDDDPNEFFQFDDVDALEEGANLRLGLLQRLVHSSEAGPGRRVSEFVWLDLAQNVATDPNADNDGHTLGLFEFEAVLRPHEDWLGLPDVQFAIDGEQDWNEDELRTFNNVVTVRTGEVIWLGEYRSDQTANGVVGYGAVVPIRRRWELFGRGQYDLERDENLNWVARLTRQDLNWRMSLELVFDLVADDTSLRVMFEPNFGGLYRPRTADWFNGLNFGAQDYTRY